MKKLLALAAAIGLVATPAMAANTISWTGYTDYPNSASPWFIFFKNTAEQVKAESHGTFNIKTVVGGGLPIKGADVCSAVADDIVQMGVCGSATAGYLPIYNIATLPLLYHTKAQLWKAMDQVVGPAIGRALDKRGIKLLAMYSYPYHSIWTVDKKITKLADLKGLKIRTLTPPQAALLQAYGAITVNLTTSAVAGALQHHAIDGFVTASGGAAKLWIDEVKYNYRTRLSWGPGMVTANLAAFNKLPAADQKLLLKAAQKWSKWVTDTTYNEEGQITNKWVKTKGLIVTPYNAEDVAKAHKIARKVWEEEAKKIGPEGVKVLHQVEKLLGE